MDVICSVLRVCGDSEQPSVTQPQEEELQSGDDLRLPQTVLFPPERIILNWTQQFNVGAGLENVGNTCYLNSALQCLTYTPPFANYMLSREHSATCKKLGFCMMCTMQDHISEVFEKSGDTITPVEVLTVLKLIANHFHFGRQEDAHEFLQCTLEAMQESCLAESKFDREVQETTFIHQVFGGHLRSRVKCLNCQAVSDTFEPFLNILLDIKTAADVSRALKQFVRPEVLSGSNAYNCGSCKNMVTATKGLTIHRGTNILILVLKRFDIFTGEKITKEVRYPEYLDLYPFMSETQENPLVYRLYAVLVHYGRSSHSGHYICYIKASNDQWYQMNDNSVTIADIKSVLTKQAYVLFYIKTTEVTETGDHNHMMTSNATVKDPQLPVHLTKVNTARDRYPSFYNVYPANGLNSYYDGSNRKREWGYEQRRHSHPTRVWKGYWKKQHQRPWVSKNTYIERYYDPWKEQMYSSPRVYNHFQQAQNGKDYLYQGYQNRRKSMLHRKISNKGTVNHFRAERESRPETHQDGKEETMRTAFMEIR